MRRLLLGLGAVILVVGLAYGGYRWYQARGWVSTDDAYVDGTITAISAKVPGHVVELLVQDNQAVKKGDLLLRIDPRDYLVRRDQAASAVATAEATLRAARSEVPRTRDDTAAQIDQARAALEAAGVAVSSAEAAVEEARARLAARLAAADAMRAEVAGAESAARQAGRERERMDRLVKGGFVAQRDFDAADSTMETATASLDATRRRLLQSEREIQQAEAELRSRRLAVDQAQQRVAEARAALARTESGRHQIAIRDAESSRAEAQLREARADLAHADLQLQYTEVRAPGAGIVSKRTVELGQIVQTGQPLLAIVPLHEVWVVANFKETQLARVHPGQRAEITVDGLPGKKFVGTVHSISAGTGARFSLLPPENATGNWVKVVQRIPVKILLDDREVGNPQPLRAGMSVIASIEIGEGARRSAP
jgi:membrane fusion protein (multidrug efflux system)